MVKRIFSGFLLLFLVIFPIHLLAEEEAVDGYWKVIKESDGIVTSSKAIAGRSLPAFKSQVVLDEALLDILAVMQDTQRNCEWMHSCVESRRVKQFKDWEVLIYNRTGAPWPVSDRDVLLQTSVSFSPDFKNITVRFKAVESNEVLPVKNVVRMPALNGEYLLESIDSGQTRVTYKVEADPGGLIPKWVVKLASRNLSHRTLKSLRQQVNATRGNDAYAAFKARFSKKSP